jgi:hypothetical protein
MPLFLSFGSSDVLISCFYSTVMKRFKMRRNSKSGGGIVVEPVT